jgi:uncharacterized protein (TIGR02117 family)
MENGQTAAGCGRRATLVAPLAAAALALPAGCAAPPPPPPDPALAADSPTIHVVAREWHTDIALPVAAIAHTPLAAALAPTFPGATHLVFGFGERGFFTAPEPGSGTYIAALFPGPGAILVTGLRAPPAEAFDPAKVVALRVSRPGLDRLARFVWDDLEKDAQGRPRVLQEGPYPGSVFYASSATYTLGYTCNTWTATGLRTAGLPINPAGVLFVHQMMARARDAAALQAAAPPPAQG